ncbi:MAG: PTS sugar transporter subunit IIA [Treponema sp.]|nr:PTS sugar transporter subunit IIA [Treponema sp.]MBQ7882419.1 PTS sugar transporter subunit IIA [Treponema sp.]
MVQDVNIGEFLRQGGVYHDIEGSTVEEVFDDICKKINLPSEISAESLYKALITRESRLSTAVGNGVSIPHAQQPILKDFYNQRIYVCYLKNPIEMHALDNKKIKVMIVILTSSVKSHLHIISMLARLLQKAEFKRALELQSKLEDIYKIVRKI